MREIGAVIDAEGVVRVSRHDGDRPRLVVLSFGDGDRDQVGQIELARGAAGADLIQRPPRPIGIERHQPGIDLGRTDAHCGVIVASLGDPHRSLIAVAHDAAVAAGILEGGGQDRDPGPGCAQSRRGVCRRSPVPAEGGRCRGQRTSRPQAGP